MSALYNAGFCLELIIFVLCLRSKDLTALHTITPDTLLHDFDFGPYGVSIEYRYHFNK